MVNSKPRITILSPSAGINHSGGAEAFSIEISRRLSSSFDVELLAGSNRSCAEAHSIWAITRSDARKLLDKLYLSYPLSKIATHPDIVVEHLTSFLPCLWRLLSHPPDLILPCNDYGGLAVAAVARVLKGTPVLYTQHTGSLANNKPLRRNLWFQPDGLIVFSPETAHFVREHYPHQSVDVIHNGVDLNRFSVRGLRLDLNLPGPIALCVASLCKADHKRVDLTLNAVAKLPNLSLLICGDGPDRLYYQELGEQLLGKERFAIRTFSFDKMPEVYRSVDLFTLASIDEPCALSYLEAMASGLPVVTTADPMRRHTIGDAGILCDVTNPGEYADALQDVLSQSWEDRACRNAARFSWDAVIKDYEQVILRTIERSSMNSKFAKLQRNT